MWPASPPSRAANETQEHRSCETICISNQLFYMSLASSHHISVFVKRNLPSLWSPVSQKGFFFFSFPAEYRHTCSEIITSNLNTFTMFERRRINKTEHLTQHDSFKWAFFRSASACLESISFPSRHLREEEGGGEDKLHRFWNLNFVQLLD